MAGSRVKIWKQDPSVESIGIRSSYISTEVQNGPADQDIVLQGMPHVVANAQNDFIFYPEENPLEFDAVHTFSIVRQVLTMLRRALNRMQITQNFNWFWGPEPIQVYPRAGLDANAYYSRNEKALRFYYFHPSGDTSNPLIYSCRSFDIVAHEVGHAALDSLKPEYLSSSWHPQTGGLHESFADLLAIFTMLAQMDVCEAIIVESKADLHSKSFFPALAEQFGLAFGQPMGLRNADNDLKMSDVTTEVHDISRVFTGAIYDILADFFELSQDPGLFDQAESLFRVGKYLTSLVIASIWQGPDANATYADIANKMLEQEEDSERKELIRQQFRKREILDAPVGLAGVQPRDLSWEGCCGTMRLKEHQNLFEKSIGAASG
ncbi:MAG: hypothetical protein P1P86_14765 [Bacteroidales bacterium]|nr:hypothetical protein [Bacteroidales bacterium]